MAIPIEGFTVVAKKDRVSELLDRDQVSIPNTTQLADDELWRCAFMAETDALKMLEQLGGLGLNVERGPDPDAVLVSEFDRSVNPYCEWLELAVWEKAVIAWLAGTQPEKLTTRQGWDPAVGSGLSFHDPETTDNLEFLRVDGKVEVYRDKTTGKEVYIGRTSEPLEPQFQAATNMILKYNRTAGENSLAGKAADEVSAAVEALEHIIAERPDSWRALWFHGKGLMALGNFEAAFVSFRRAFQIEREHEAVLRELAGVCIELGKFNEAVDAAQRAVALEPEDHELIANLALTYLMAGRLPEARKSIDAAMKIAYGDKVTDGLYQIIGEVESGQRPQPQSIRELTKATQPAVKKKRWWMFWK